MSNTKTEAQRLADELRSHVQTYPQMSEDEPGGYCSQDDQLMDEAATELLSLDAQNKAMHKIIDQLRAQVERLQGGEPVTLTDEVPAHVAGLLEHRRELDAIEFFESANRDSHGFRRSVRGTYVNPAVARDWKWFQLGMQHATKE